MNIKIQSNPSVKNFESNDQNIHSTFPLSSQSLSQLSAKEQTHLFQLLQSLCQNFDPFSPQLTPDVQHTLSTLHLEHLASNPFQLTQEILILLDSLYQLLNKKQ